jgi:beta-1,4-mannosyl-glycoprotein beta-1,4-N-acetylglucosaminyltransferase
MMIDGFLFYDETDLLVRRFEELGDLVDAFVIVEGLSDFRGRPRKPEFPGLRAGLPSVAAKVIYRQIDLPATSNPWLRELLQRNEIASALPPGAPNDLVIISDVDEIPSAGSIARCPSLELGEICALEMHFLWYGARWEYPTPWTSTRIVSRATLQLMSPQEVRTAKPTRMLVDGGWHLSYFYQSEELLSRIRHKAESFSHSEFASERYLNERYLRRCVSLGLVWCTAPQITVKLRRADVSSAPHWLLDSADSSGYLLPDRPSFVARSSEAALRVLAQARRTCPQLTTRRPGRRVLQESSDE